MKQGIILGLGIIFIIGSCLAGWERTYGGSGYDEGRSIVQVADGGFAVAGTYSGVDTFGIWVLRINPTGDTLWTKIFGGSEFTTGNSIIETSDSGFVVAGFSSNFTNDDAWVLRLNSAGDTIWVKTFDASSKDRAYSIIQTTDGGFALVGETDMLGSGQGDVWVLRLDSSGDTLWSKTYGGIYDDKGYSIIPTTDGGFAVAGTYANDSVDIDLDIWIMRLDSSGDTLWTKKYGGSDWNFGYSIIQTSDDGFAVTGTYSSIVNTDIWVLKLNSFGDTVWTKTYGGTDGEMGHSIVQTFDDGFAITGPTRSFGAGAVDIWILRLDSFGDTLWTRTFGGTDWDRSYSIVQTSDSGFAVVGHTYSFGIGGDVYLIKTDSLGYTAIGEAPSARPEEIAISAFPNPFNSVCRISVDCMVLINQNHTIEIFDLAGRQVAQLPSPSAPLPGGEGGNSFSLWEKVSEGRMRAEFIWQPDKSLGSGVYLIRIKGANASKKIIYMK